MRNWTSKTKNSNVFWAPLCFLRLFRSRSVPTMRSIGEPDIWHHRSIRDPPPKALHRGAVFTQPKRYKGAHFAIHPEWPEYIWTGFEYTISCIHSVAFTYYTRSCTHTNPTCYTLSQTHAHTQTHTHTYTHAISQVHTISCHPHMHTAHTHTYTHITHTASHFLVEIWKLV